MNINLTLFAQALTFAAFIWFTVKVVWPPLLRAMEARQKNIADGLAAAEQGRRSLEESKSQAEETIARACSRFANSSASRPEAVAWTAPAPSCCKYRRMIPAWVRDGSTSTIVSPATLPGGGVGGSGAAGGDSSKRPLS